MRHALSADVPYCLLLASRLGFMKEHVYHRQHEGKGKPYETDGSPSSIVPGYTCAQRAEAAASEQMAHEDGVAAVGGFRDKRETTALVAQLVALCSYVYK